MKYLQIGLILMMLISACSQPGSGRKHKALDPANMDLSYQPGDDFFRYANGNWIKNNPVPAEYSRWGTFEMLAEQNRQDLRSIFEEAAQNKGAEPGSNTQKIGDFFASGMDSAKIEEQGLSPLQPELDRVAALQSTQDVQRYISYLHRMQISPLFFFFAEQDQQNSAMVIPWLYQGGLGLPDRDYYFDTDGRAPEIREKYIDHLQKMCMLMGDTEADAKHAADVIMGIETRLAKVSMTRLEQRNPKAITNKMTLQQLQENSAGFDWMNYFTEVGLGDPGELNVAQPKFFSEVGKVMKSVSVADWKIYLRWNLVNETAAYLSSDFVDQNFEFYGKVLSGQPEMQPRWKRTLETVSGNLGEVVGQVYVERFFPPEAKERMFELVMNLKAAFGERIKNVQWMSDETKEKALTKLDAFGVKVGYPDEWIDYSSLEIDSDSYVGNVLRSREFEFQRGLKKMNQPVDRKEWGMTPQTVNAYYNPLLNEVVFPAAILQPPFFNLQADDAVNYGAIGAVIGHEMTHGFDDQGRQYDVKGNLSDWWTEEDSRKFDERTRVLVEQFNNYVILDTNKVNGELTLGENIADLGGMSIAFDALKMATAAKTARMIDGYTPEQRFFLSWAQVWSSNIRDEDQLMRLKTDVHSPAEARVNCPVRNIETFYSAFDVKEGDKLYLASGDRANIW